MRNPGKNVYKYVWKLVTIQLVILLHILQIDYKSCCYYISRWFLLQIRLILHILLFITNQGDIDHDILLKRLDSRFSICGTALITGFTRTLQTAHNLS